MRVPPIVFSSFLLLGFFVLLGCSAVDKTLYDLSNSVSSVDRVSGKRTVNLHERETQIKQSNAIVEQLLKEKYTDKDLPINEAINAADYARIQNVFKRVHAVSHLKDEDWSVVMVPEESFNAFVTGGTDVVVHHGLLKEIQSDDELAYILGHELAHVSANHVYESQAYNIGAMIAGSKSAKRNSFQAAFTHENEEEADKIGLLYATLAGYDPSKGAETWRRMGEKFGYHASTYSTHPIAKERASNNEYWASRYRAYYIPNQINPDHQEVLINNPVFGVGSIKDKPKPGEGGGLQAVMDTVMAVFTTRAKAKNEEIRQTNRIDFIQSIQQSMRLVRQERISDKSIRVTIDYQGAVPIKEVVFRGQYGQETSIAPVDRIVQPGERIIIDFVFEKQEISPDDNRLNLRMALDYAEPV